MTGKDREFHEYCYCETILSIVTGIGEGYEESISHTMNRKHGLLKDRKNWALGHVQNKQGRGKLRVTIGFVTA